MFDLESDKYERESRKRWKEIRSAVIAIVVVLPIVLLAIDLTTAYKINKIEKELRGRIDAGLCTMRQPCEITTSAGCQYFKDGPEAEATLISMFSHRAAQQIPAIVVNRGDFYCYRGNTVHVKFVAMPGVRR